MAEFKRALASASGDGFSFDGATLAALGDATGAFWPLIAGTLILIILLVRGESQAVIPVGGGMMLLQAWQAGMFG